MALPEVMSDAPIWCQFGGNLDGAGHVDGLRRGRSKNKSRSIINWERLAWL